MKFNIRCKHDYVYFDKTLHDPFSGMYDYHFCCTKCEKNKTIRESCLRDDLEQYRLQENRMRALGKWENSKSVRLSLPRGSGFRPGFEGEYVYELIKDYQKSGINLDIPEFQNFGYIEWQ